MSMVADEIESKQSAKTRLFQGLKRRVANNSSRIEIFEEEMEDEEEEVPEAAEAAVPLDRRDLRMTIRVDNDRRPTNDSVRGLNERFHARPEEEGKRMESGDSLEMDKGEDLRAELDGKQVRTHVKYEQIQGGPKVAPPPFLGGNLNQLL